MYDEETAGPTVLWANFIARCAESQGVRVVALNACANVAFSQRSDGDYPNQFTGFRRDFFPPTLENRCAYVCARKFTRAIDASTLTLISSLAYSSRRRVALRNAVKDYNIDEIYTMSAMTPHGLDRLKMFRNDGRKLERGDRVPCVAKQLTHAIAH